MTIKKIRRFLCFLWIHSWEEKQVTIRKFEFGSACVDIDVCSVCGKHRYPNVVKNLKQLAVDTLGE